MGENKVSQSRYRILNEEEIVLSNRVEMNNVKRKNLRILSEVKYEKQENFTIAVLGVLTHPWLNPNYFIGVTKRAVNDIDRPEHARRLAFRRAVEAYARS